MTSARARFYLHPELYVVSHVALSLDSPPQPPSKAHYLSLIIIGLPQMELAGESKDIALEPSESQHLKKGRRARSWDRVVVYDCESRSVEIRKRQDVDKGNWRPLMKW